MDGKNSSGRRVSLLNDGPEAPTLVRLPSITPSLRSRTSSYTSSPIGSPPTPRLIRSDSSDSATMNTPSPITPDFAPFDSMSQGMPSPGFPQDHYFAMQSAVMRQHNMHMNAMPHSDMKSDTFTNYAPHIVNQVAYQAQPQVFYSPQMSEQHISAPAPAPASVRPKKNSYPCPMAKQFGCSDYFTTSGHAARHAKKHTGKKDAFCPECNKAFTRKDNMEQHRRTHQSGRSAKCSDNGVKKAKPAAKRPRASPMQSSEQAQLHSVDPVLHITPHPTGFIAPAVPSAEDAGQYAQYSPTQEQRSTHAYPDPTQYSMNHLYNTGTSSGLDALAIAASSEKRKFE
ncbi:uncharacterized protein M421DRAFT_418469 [Didymella exigua CBS 183.55]|uniref:C2H2-type domain-containing protein n=1 Tax=Didymella exigua CBS 183.55 TaxID=1150837 RepID=A0A6A5RRC0_9PLEO|nr:uncharacterized protein M421DRAFT_418469 [Didymella exigua CBS 183.55]KAF1930981.1 hypothetical protein M421DRAFT_418469 [Didymella exigua CBS 183.55]